MGRVPQGWGVGEQVQVQPARNQPSTCEQALGEKCSVMGEGGTSSFQGEASPGLRCFLPTATHGSVAHCVRGALEKLWSR